MATLDNIMDYLANIAPPTFDTITEVYTRTGKYDATYTIPETGWYILEVFGFWNATTIKINSNTVAVAQVTSGTSEGGTNAGMYLFRAGTVLTLHAGENKSYIIIRRVQ